MARTTKRSKRKVSGGRYIDYRKKRDYEILGTPTNTKVGKEKIKSVKKMGGERKYKILVAESVNVYNPKTKKYTKAKISGVIESPANRNFVKRNIITKGCIVKTDAGNVKITSRPGQVGVLDGILVE
jgi:small subunit ribosomal protein S8e